MDNLQFWIWVIVIIVTLIARSGKKKPVPGNRPATPIPDQETEESTSQPMSFEDLLREIQAKRNPPTQPAPEPRKEYQIEDYDDNLGDEEEDLEEVEYDYRKQDTIYKTYDDSKEQAFNRPALEETMSREDQVIQFGQFKEYEQVEARRKFDFLEEIKDPDGFKKAFIMSEILTRKY